MPTFYAPGTRKGNKHWLIRGYVDGRQYETTAEGARSKREAQAHWDAYAADIRRSGPAEPELTFSHAVQHYQDTGQRSKQQMAFVKAIERELGDRLVGSIRPGDIRALARRLYPGARASTWNRQVIAPAAAVINCYADDDRCPHIRVKRFGEEPVLKRQPSPMAGEILLNATDGYKKLLIAAYHYQGLRPSDAQSMRWDGVDLQRRTFSLVVPKVQALKTIAMDAAFWLLMANVPELERHGWVFPWRSRSGVDHWLKPLCERLGVRFSARQARHLFASDMAAQGASELDLVNVGSWTSERSVKHYVSLREARARELLDSRNQGKNKGRAG